MHVTLVEINVKQDKIDEFIDVPRQSSGAIEEPGNLRFDVLQDEHIPTRFTSTKPIATSRRWRRTSRPHTICSAWRSWKR